MNYTFFPVHRQLPKAVQLFNKILKRMHIHYEMVSQPRFNKEYITTEQSMNLYHLLSEVIFYKVQGEIIELGSHTGQSAIMMQAVIENMNDDRTLIVYDKFDLLIKNREDKEIFTHNFKKSSLRMPRIHQGLVEKTLPSNLPAKIAFVHIDLGLGGGGDFYKLIIHCLQSIYPRMAPGAVCMLMDYHDPDLTLKGNDENPGIKKACDDFFSQKDEKVFVLYGNQYSHGYFRKNIPAEFITDIEKLTKKRSTAFERSKKMIAL